MTIYNKTLFFIGAIIFISVFVYTAVRGVDNFYYDGIMVVGIVIMLLGLKKPKEIKQ